MTGKLQNVNQGQPSSPLPCNSIQVSQSDSFLENASSLPFSPIALDQSYFDNTNFELEDAYRPLIQKLASIDYEKDPLGFSKLKSFLVLAHFCRKYNKEELINKIEEA